MEKRRWPPSILDRTVAIAVFALALFQLGAPTDACGAEPKVGSPALATEALPQLLQRGVSSFTAGDFPAAAQAFAKIENDFGDETSWLDGTLPRRLLPLRGFAELRAGLAEAAADTLAEYLERFPGQDQGFASFALAIALREANHPRDAIEQFEVYEAAHAGSAQAALAALLRGDMLASVGETDRALEIWITLAAGEAPRSLTIAARLRALQVAIDSGRNDVAERLLLGSRWDVATMPEIAVLSFAAMETGDRLLATNQPADAVRAYRLALPKEILIATQRARLAELRDRIRQGLGASAPAGGNLAFWADFYRARETLIARQLDALESADDYTPALQLRRGQAFLLANRPYEAWLLFEDLAIRADTTDEIRTDAHYRWILAAAALERWDHALVIARDFVLRHPGSSLAPEAFHLIARAHLERQRFDEAEIVLSDILTRFPTHPSAGRARFTRGWVRVMRDRYADARGDFEGYLDEHPSGPLATQAGLWRALAFFFERRHAEALAALEQLASTAHGHPLYPEILYRRATTLYAMRETQRARTELEAFVHDYPAHARRSEALVLLGDLLMGTGELDKARQCFAEIPINDTRSFVHGVFQTGLILRKLDDLNALVAHFSDYVARSDVPGHPRISEALYWIGWGEDRRGNAAAALPAFFDVLERFGNDPAASDIGTTLSALERLARRTGREQSSGHPDPIETGLSPLAAVDFDRWLAEETERARGTNRQVYEARLRVHAADRFAEHGRPNQAEATLLNLAGDLPPEALDDHGLARVGMVLHEIGSPDGPVLLHRLVASFPASPERAVAFVGLADSCLQSGKPTEALAWADRFERETPSHALAPRACLIAGVALETLNRPADAADRYQAIMRLRSARGRLQAEALAGLARCFTALGDAAKAIGCHQRVYTLHRAQHDLVATAYLESGRLFESSDNLQAAAASYREFLASSDLGTSNQREQAHRALAALETRLSPEAAQTPAIPTS